MWYILGCCGYKIFIMFYCLSGPATSPQPPPTNPDVKNSVAPDNGQMDLTKVLEPQHQDIINFHQTANKKDQIRDAHVCGNKNVRNITNVCNANCVQRIQAEHSMAFYLAPEIKKKLLC